MNALLKKEIRLLLPGWVAILLLEILQPWFLGDPDNTFGIAPVIFFFGMIIFAVDSFGREFSLGTFQSLLAQPIERRQIWRTKIPVLFFAVALIFAGYFASCELRLHQIVVDSNSVWHFNTAIIESDFAHAMTTSGALLFVALTGGLWTALLLRQIASAFWITFLTPAILLMVIAIFMSKFFNSASDMIVGIVLYSAAFIYSISGFWLAHRLFHRAQDVAWTGGVISFSKWRYFESGSKSSISTRDRKPLTALLKKEFQLQSISLFCACALLALHIGVFSLRIFYANFHKNSFADGVSEFFWALWLVMPLVIGGTAVAEERKLGVAEQQFCLPVSRRVQFAVKFIPTMFFGVLLGGVMPILLETVAAHLGAPIEFFKLENNSVNNFGFNNVVLFEISILALSAGFSLAAFFASTLARNFLQALSIAIVTIVGCCLFWSFIKYTGEQRASLFGILPWPSVLPVLIAIPTIAITCLWLVYRNFSYFHERGRLWRRNIIGVIGALLFVFVSSAMIYNRVWEFFEPAEPPHGVAKLSLSNPPKLTSEFDNLLVRLPDGRVWFDSLEDFYEENNYSRWKQLWWSLIRPLPQSTGPQQFIDGSNWMSVTARRVAWWNPVGTTPSEAVHVFGYLDTVGVKSDGTLWISSKSVPKVWTGKQMAQFGDETNWLQVTRSYGASFGNFLLLKNDGTLWRWGNNHFTWDGWQTNWPSARTFQPRQIGTNSDWKEIFNGWIANAKKTDGTAWVVALDSKTGKDVFERRTNYDQVVPQTFSQGNNRSAYVGKDGTLWIGNYLDENGSQSQQPGYLRVGVETNWVTTAMNQDRMIALKTDGSLWQWKLNTKTSVDAVRIPPTRLGIHGDWVGLTGTWDGVVSLAADGSLWFWPRTDYSEAALLESTQAAAIARQHFWQRGLMI
jgi:ABC-type transport system involved in multi-copper enzyme maturation permease subunit